MTVSLWNGRAGQGGAGLWSEAEGSTFGGERDSMAEGIGYGILSRLPKSGGRGSGGSDRAARAGLVRWGCLGRAAETQLAGSPWARPALEPSATLLCHLTGPVQRRGRGLIPSAPRPGRDLEEWNQGQRLRVPVALLEERAALGLNTSPPMPEWKPC